MWWLAQCTMNRWNCRFPMSWFWQLCTDNSGELLSWGLALSIQIPCREPIHRKDTGKSMIIALRMKGPDGQTKVDAEWWKRWGWWLEVMRIVGGVGCDDGWMPVWIWLDRHIIIPLVPGLSDEVARALAMTSWRITEWGDLSMGKSLLKSC